jgi:ferredoxin
VVNLRWLKPLRVIISILFFIGFIVLFSDVKANVPSGLYKLLGYFQFFPSILKFSDIFTFLSAGFILVIIITLFSGRIYCSFLCPLGILQDIIGYGRKLLPRKKIRYRYAKPLNNIRYSILGILVVSIFIYDILLINILDPYANFGRIASNLYQPTYILVNNFLSKILEIIGINWIQNIAQKEFSTLPFIFSLSVLVLIIWMVYKNGRLYCNSICPVGSILGLISKISFLRIKIDNTNCTQCGKCQTSCKANCIDVKTKSIDESRCVSCFNCIQSCSESAIGYRNIITKKESLIIVQTDKSKRDFLKSGILFLTAIPLVSDTLKTNSNSVSNIKITGTISPPGSISIDHLKNNCVGCQLCISICPGKVLQPSFLEYGFTAMMAPRMDNNIGYCNYECTKCGEVCPSGAIMPLSKKEKKLTQIGIVHFEKDRCIVITENKSCGSCSEHCPTQAVHMVPYKGSLTLPETEQDICIGCGACEHACPVEPEVAIFVVSNLIHKTAKEPVSEKIKVEKTEEFPF